MIERLTLYSNASTSLKANKVIREITTIAAGMKRLHPNGNYGNQRPILLMETLINAKAISDDITITSRDGLSNAFGRDTYMVSLDHSSISNPSVFIIQVFGFTAKTCYKVLAHNIGAYLISPSYGICAEIDTNSDCIDPNLNFSEISNICNNIPKNWYQDSIVFIFK